MKSKYIFILMVFAEVIIAAAMPFLLSGNSLVFIEIIIGLLLVFSVILYRKLIRPMELLRTGLALMRGQDFASRLVCVGPKEADELVELFNSLMDKIKNERLKVRETNHFLDLLIKESPTGIIVLDFDNNISGYNSAACRVLEIAGIEGMNITALPGAVGNVLASLKCGEAKTLRLQDNRIVRCSLYSFLDRGFQRPFVLIETLTEEVMKAERNAYGKVIRVISHEVNNTLAGILPMLDIFAEMSADAETRDVAQSAAERCRSLGQFIKAYADVVKVPAPVLTRCNLNNLLISMRSFLESMTVDRNIDMSFKICDEDVFVDADSVLLEQVIVNVVKNSVESIGNDGCITISLTSSPACMEIIDNGAGISREAAANIFEPFFSTKAGSQGIGLTLVSEILQKHACRYSLVTTDDGLTRFTIRFI